jgi:HD superfamily phosphohydrolase
MAIDVFNGTYHKKFLHQLVSSQLDMDRMDYLTRDSFFTGVSEGVISFDRIIKMLNVKDDYIVIEEKGIYSIEKFLVARRLMYWQVYLHKTVIAAELMLGKILERSRELALGGEVLFATPALNYFLTNNITINAFVNSSYDLDTFASLDDTDIMSAIKVWATHDDFILATLCQNLINRNLYHVELSNTPPSVTVIDELVERVIEKYGISEDEASYFIFTDSITNKAYKVGDGNIRILMKDGSVQDITDASDNSNLEALAKTVKKYVLCCIKGL